MGTPDEKLDADSPASLCRGLSVASGSDGSSRMLMVFNFFVLILFLGGGSYYIVAYTNGAELLGGFFTLSGAFAWIAFATNLLSDGFKSGFQKIFEEKVIKGKKTWWIVLVIIVVGFVAFPARHGTIFLEGLGDDTRRVLKVWPESGPNPAETESASTTAEPIEKRLLPPHSTARVFVPTSLFGSREFRVKASGLPSGEVKVLWGERLQIDVPEFFLLRTGILLRPKAENLTTLAAGALTLKVSVGTRHFEESDYNGEAIWIGVDEDVAVPAHLITTWRSKVRDPRDSYRWERPLVRMAPPPLMVEGEKIEARLLTKDGNLWGYVCELVREPSKGEDFPQEVLIGQGAENSC